MDIYCPKCGEPWDNEEFHEVAADNKAERDRLAALGQLPRPGTVGAMMANRDKDWLPATYQAVVESFRRKGCVALGGSPCVPATGAQAKRAQASAVLMELGDMDGAMSELEDLEFLGFFDGEDGE